jgi:5-(carboxyamino)imidazole ribonucleotide synthase
VLALTGASLHLYGKPQARPGRKMGHLTITAETARGAQTTAWKPARRWASPPSDHAARRT